MTQHLAVARYPSESIADMIARYEVCRQRPETEGQFVMSIEGYTLQILRQLNVQPAEIPTLLSDTNGNYPRTEP